MENSNSRAVGAVNSFSRAGLILVVFFSTCSQLVSFQLDKAMMFMLVGAMLFHYFYKEKKVSVNAFFLLLLSLGVITVSYLLNLPNSSLIVFFPIIGLAFVYLIGKEDSFLDLFYWALFIHIALGILFVVSSYLIGINSFVHPMFDKGLPFLHAAKGLTTTVQAYGTLIIAWFLIYYWKKDLSNITFLDQLAYFFALIGIVLTFNRNSLLVYYIILLFKHKKIFWISIVIALAFYFYFFEYINKLIFNFSTLTSRADLLQAFRIAFFEQTDWLGYLVGHGNNHIEDSIARGTFYGTGYIENGTAVLLYTYGFVGYLLFLIFVLSFSLALFLKDQVFYSAIFFYIFVIGQQFTHEFFSTTIYILLSIFVLLYNSSKVNYYHSFYTVDT